MTSLAHGKYSFHNWELSCFCTLWSSLMDVMAIVYCQGTSLIQHRSLSYGKVDDSAVMCPTGPSQVAYRAKTKLRRSGN